MGGKKRRGGNLIGRRGEGRKEGGPLPSLRKKYIKSKEGEEEKEKGGFGGFPFSFFFFYMVDGSMVSVGNLRDNLGSCGGSFDLENFQC